MADVERVLRRSRPVLVASMLLILVMVAAMASGPQATRLPLPEVSHPGQPAPAVSPPAAPMLPTPTPIGPAHGDPPPAWVSVLGLVLALVVVVGLLAAVVVLLRRYVRLPVGWRRPAPEVAATSEETPSGTGEEVRAAVAAGLEALADDAGDPRRAVIGCWLRLEKAAAAAGSGRRPDDTPADLVARLLGGHRVSEAPLHELAHLYRRARYAPDDVDEAMRAQAHATLTQIQDELTQAELTSTGPGEASHSRTDGTTDAFVEEARSVEGAASARDASQRTEGSVS